MTDVVTIGDATLHHGDCRDVMRGMPADSVDAIVTDPPYGLEFMGKAWDKLAGAGMSKPGIGERATEWPSFGGANFGGANPTCAVCGGRLRGEKKCACAEPDWRVKGKTVERKTETGREMQEWHYAWAVEALRVAKPGAHLLAFGGTRTFHRLACAIEDAGWEIRDCVMWVYGSGFPKSLDVSKAIDKARDDRVDIEAVVRFLESARQRSGVSRGDVEQHFGTVNIGQAFFTITPGSAPRVPMWDQWLRLKSLFGFNDEMDAEVWRLNGRKGQPGEAWDQREVIGRSENGIAGGTGQHAGVVDSYGFARGFNITAPATDSARQWQGWGTALKPAWEPIIVARKPLIGTVAENVLKHGTGALNIDVARVAAIDGYTENAVTQGINTARTSYEPRRERRTFEPQPLGRWPANLILSYPEDEYELRSDLTQAQRKEALGWLYENA